MPAATNKPKRYVVTYDGGFIAWQYREAKDSDKGERIWYRECDYAALAAENERLRKAVERVFEDYEHGFICEAEAFNGIKAALHGGSTNPPDPA